jgi:hypothetical protein
VRSYGPPRVEANNNDDDRDGDDGAAAAFLASGDTSGPFAVALLWLARCSMRRVRWLLRAELRAVLGRADVDPNKDTAAPPPPPGAEPARAE